MNRNRRCAVLAAVAPTLFVACGSPPPVSRSWRSKAEAALLAARLAALLGVRLAPAAFDRAAGDASRAQALSETDGAIEDRTRPGPQILAGPDHLDEGAFVLTFDGKRTRRDIAGPLCSVLDALETRYPMSRGTTRDHGSKKRRAFVRFFACGRDFSDEPPDAPLPEAVAGGRSHSCSWQRSRADKRRTGRPGASDAAG